MSGRISSPSDVLPDAKMTDAIGRPVARDFFEPQNWMAMESPRLNPSFALTILVSHSMKKTSAVEKSIWNRICQMLIDAHIPSTMPFEKAAYTTIAMDPRSTILVALLAAIVPVHRRVS